MSAPLIVIAVVVVLIWAFLVLPSRRRQRAHEAMQDQIAEGDEVITAGGIHGTVREASEEDVRVEIAPGVVVTLDRRAIAAVAVDAGSPEQDAPAEPKPDAS
jgi:preprotein translocase subunit YajC